MQIPVNCLHNVFLAMYLSQHEEFSSKLGQVEERYMQVYKDTTPFPHPSEPTPSCLRTLVMFLITRGPHTSQNTSNLPGTLSTRWSVSLCC